MARKKTDLNQKVVELRRILDQYGGIPSIQQDKAAYLNLYYYLNRYGDVPQIQELMSEYNLEDKANNNHKRCTDINQKVEELKKILDQYGGIPSQQQDKAAYSNIYYNFKKYAHLPEIQELIAKYNVAEKRNSNAPRRKKDLDQKVDELKQILDKYGCIPTQQQDRAAYANINYYLKRYGDEPQIQELMSTYNIKAGRRADIDTQINEIAAILQEFGRIPAVKDNETLYYRIRGFFQNHKEHPEVIKLKYLYAHGSCFPLPKTKYGPKPDANPQFDSWDHKTYVSDEWIEWRNNVTYEYIEYVYKQYQLLPAIETKPMLFLKDKVSHWYRYNVDTNKTWRKALYDFLKRMIDIGCDDAIIKEAYYSFMFDDEEIQNRVNKMLVDNGACAIHYIAQTIIPGHPLSDEFVYYYYYVKLNDKPKFRGIMPLASLCRLVDPYSILKVHYRDYHKCNIDQIRESAQNHYRNWTDNPPKTINEWKYYGQSKLFTHKVRCCDLADRRYGQDLDIIDWTTTIIDKYLSNGELYFDYYNGRLRYLDYYLYLLENGFTLTNKRIKQFLGVEGIADDNDIIDDDLFTLKKLIIYLPDCFCDSDGGYYLKENDNYILLFLSKNIQTYKLHEKTIKISRNAFKLVDNYMENIIINNKLITNQLLCHYPLILGLYNCDSLKTIYVHPEYLDLFKENLRKDYHHLLKQIN